MDSEDFRILLDQISNAAILIQLSEKRVIAVNYQYTQLTGFGTDELYHAGLERVLVDVEPEKIKDGNALQWSLIRKNKNPIQTLVNASFVNQNDQLVLLIIQEIEDKETRPESLAMRMLEGLLKINETFSDISLETLTQKITQTGRNVFLSKTCTFYMLESERDQALKIQGEDKLFPQSLPAIEMNRLGQIDFWEPGKRVLSEIHRAGRLNNLMSIITLPVTVNNDTSGLLVLAWENMRPGEDWLLLLQIYAEWANILFKNQQIQEIVGAKNAVLGLENDQYAQYYENAGDSAILINKENIIIDINQNSAQLLKYTPIELLNQKAAVIFENSELADKLAQEDLSEQAFNLNPTVIYDREGSRKPVFYKIVPLERKGAGRRLLILKDATIQVEAEQKIQQYENKAALGEVIADFAHEVRNPIHSFVSGLQIMKKKADPQDPALETINQMMDDCFRINDLMESVLSYSRQKVENFKDINVELLIRRIFSSMNTKFTRANVSAMVTCKTEMRNVYADQRSLEQVFINIITNAYDAIKPEGGVISVQIAPNETDERFLDVSISDTGPGIPPEIQEKIFEPFVTGKPKGTGLGLAITKRMVEAHKGLIELETYPGGTIFKVILPTQEISGE
jgi:PAS domain S-box-containing protein